MLSIQIIALLSNDNCGYLIAVICNEFDYSVSHPELFLKKIRIVFQQVMFSCISLMLKSNNWKNTLFPYIDMCFVTIGTSGALSETGNEGRPGIVSG